MSPFTETEDSYQQGSRTLPRECYASAEVFAEETERLFRDRWVCVGRESELARVGDYFLAFVAGESLIVVRTEDGVIHALYNVCRHRGTRLCEEEHGTLAAGTIQCPYHAWTYGLDGRLVAAPHMAGVEGFDASDYPLHRAAVDIWEGFVFVHLGPRPQPLEAWLEPLLDRFSRFNLSSLRPAGRIRYDVEANWKLLFQNYSECLHCPVIHPQLSRLTPFKSATNDLTEGPFLGGPMRIAGGGSMTSSGAACAPPVGDLPPEDLHRVYYYSLFPNMLLSLHPDYVMVHLLTPMAHDHTRVVCEWLFHPDTFDDLEADPDDAIAFWDTTNREDWQICEQAQAGVTSRAYTPGPYSPRESLPAAWDREYLGQMGKPADP